MATRRLLTTTTTAIRRLTTEKTTPRFSLLRTLSATSRLTLPTLPPSSRRLFCTQNAPNDSKPNRESKENVLLDGCDFEHWLIVLDPPPQDWSREQIIDSYVKTLAIAVGSEEEARMKLYSVSTKHYFSFGALISEELSSKLKDLENVRWVLPDSYLDVKKKDYGGEPVIDGQAVPYDPKYHEEWVRNNQKATSRNDRPRNDRSRNFDSRQRPPGGNMGGAPRQLGPPNNAGYQQNGPPRNTGYQQNMPPNNAGYQQNRPPNNAGYQQNRPPNNAGYQQNRPPNNAGYQQNRPPNNAGYQQNMPPNNAGYQHNGPPNNAGYQHNGPPANAGHQSNMPPNNAAGYQNPPNADYQSNVPGRDAQQ